MKESRSKLLLFLPALIALSCGLFAPQHLAAQPSNDDCVNSILLCGSTPLTTGNIGATTECGGADADCQSTGTWGNCYDVYNSVWFHFNTNGVGGQVTVSISNIVCNDTVGNGLDAVLLSASTPCDPTTYAAFSCNSSATDFTLNGGGLLPNTTYYVQVNGNLDTIANAGCNFDIEVSGPAVAKTVVTSSQDASCNGAADGSATATGAWGMSPYTYQWDAAANSQQTSQAFLTPAGTYSCTITDATGCDTVVQVTVNEPPPMTANFGVNEPGCGLSNGALSVSPNNGVPPYSYLWNTGATIPGISPIPAGQYTVTVTDANNCSEVFTENVSEDGAPDVTTAITPVTCYGGNDGSMTAVLSGGGGSVAFQWSSGPNDTTSTINGVAAGSYDVTVTVTTNGCVAYATAIVTQPDPWSLNLSSEPATCAGNDGSATVNYLSGGTGAITYLWDIAQTTPTATGLAPGTYSCTVSDANNCDTIVSVTVAEIPPVSDATATGNTVSCGSTNGVINISGEVGGTPPFTYSLDGSTYQAPNQFSGLAPGTYSVFVRDANNCIFTTSATIMQPDLPNVEYEVTPETCDALGSVVATNPSGGSPPYTITFNGVNGTTFNEIASGQYMLMITDSSGCDTTYTVEVPKTCVVPSKGFSPNGDGINDTWQIDNAEQFPRMEVFVYNRWGQRVFYKVNYGTQWDGTSSGVGVPDGTYFYNIFLNKDNHREGNLVGNVTIVR